MSPRADLVPQLCREIRRRACLVNCRNRPCYRHVIMYMPTLSPAHNNVCAETCTKDQWTGQSTLSWDWTLGLVVCSFVHSQLYKNPRMLIELAINTQCWCTQCTSATDSVAPCITAHWQETEVLEYHQLLWYSKTSGVSPPPMILSDLHKASAFSSHVKGNNTIACIHKSKILGCCWLYCIFLWIGAVSKI
jgi:hypothetical protein